MMDELNKAPSVDELFRVVAMDRKRKVKFEVDLRDEDGEQLNINELVESLTEYVTDQMKSDKENVTQQQIFPLMAQAVVAGMTKLMGPYLSTLMLSQEGSRYGLVYMTIMGFYLLKFIQKHDIKIFSTESAVSDEELAMYDRVGAASSMATMASHLGADPKEVIRELLKSGQLQRDDLEKLGAESLLDEDVENKKAN